MDDQEVINYMYNSIERQNDRTVFLTREALEKYRERTGDYRTNSEIASAGPERLKENIEDIGTFNYHRLLSHFTKYTRLFPGSVSRESFRVWNDALKEYNDEYKQVVKDRNENSYEEELLKYEGLFERMGQVIDEAMEGAEDIGESKKKALTLIALLYYFVPKRRDYDDLEFFVGGDQEEPPLDPDKNFIWIKGRRQVKIVLNKYKTSAVYGQIVEDAPKPFIDFLMKFWKDATTGVKVFNVYSSRQGFTMFFKRSIKGLTGYDGVNTVLFRRLYTTFVLGDVYDGEDDNTLQLVSRRMGHSVNTNRSIYLSQRNLI